mmetsp:Transcript_54072/g.123055  ORF Transcript_54072/g.123055 Transcript_54072/m.123055 type:complete len:135 (+) Transcript_54072:3-407(+)
MNVVGCWFGGMPSCHGAGGLAGQYKFGARSGCAVILLGLGKLALGLFAGQAMDTIIQVYPKPVLGVLLLFAGCELASVGLRTMQNAGDKLLPCVVTAGAYIGTKNMALGVVAGLVVALAAEAQERRQAKHKGEA